MEKFYDIFITAQLVQENHFSISDLFVQGIGNNCYNAFKIFNVRPSRNQDTKIVDNAYLNSDLSIVERDDIIEEIKNGTFDWLHV